MVCRACVACGFVHIAMLRQSSFVRIDWIGIPLAYFLRVSNLIGH